MNVSTHRLALAITFALCSWGATAHALEPTESTLVDSVTLASLYGTISADDDTTLLVGIDGCQRALAVGGNININFTLTDTAGVDLLTPQGLVGVADYNGIYYFNRDIDSGVSPSCLESTTEDCSQLGSSDVSLTSTTADVQAPFSLLTTLTGEQDCLTSGFERDYFVRMQFADLNNGSPAQADARIRVDFVRPEPPASFDAVVTDGAIELTWEDGISADVEAYRIIYSTEQFDGDVFSDEVSGSSSVTVLDTSTNQNTSSIVELEPDSVVWIAVASVDRVGNESVLTASQSYTVIDTVGFWDAYKARGGSESGGFCSATPLSSTPGGPAGTLLLCGLLFGFGAVRTRRQHGERS